MKRLLPVGSLYWAWSWYWDGTPFRVLYVGFWCIAIDRSKAWYTSWPHMSISWNDDDHN
jgi:hypothetical protein